MIPPVFFSVLLFFASILYDSRDFRLVCTDGDGDGDNAVGG